MFRFLSRLLSPAHAVTAPAVDGGIANRLLESAEARAGHDPHHAQELRDAAQAYLRVVR